MNLHLRSRLFAIETQARVSRIFRRLFRVYAHIYYAHFEYIVHEKAEVKTETCASRRVR